MKFAKFQEIRNSLSLNESVRGFSDYMNEFYAEKGVKESEESLDKFMKEAGKAAFSEDLKVMEAGGGGKATDAVANFFKNIMGYVKLNGLKSKYVKAMVDEGAEELRYVKMKEKMKQAGKDKEATETMTKAHDTKKEQQKEKTKAIADRIDDVASTDFLKKVASRIKIEARIKKSEILIKIADDERKKELSNLIGELKAKAAELESEIQKDDPSNDEDAKKAALKQLKDKISETGEEIKKINGQIEELENKLPKKADESVQEAEGDEKEESKENAKVRLEVYKELIPLKEKKAELVQQQIQNKQAYNVAAEKEEYKIDDKEENVENLKSEIENYKTQIKKLEDRVSAEETGAGDEEQPETKDDKEGPKDDKEQPETKDDKEQPETKDDKEQPETKDDKEGPKDGELTDKQKEKIAKAEAGLKKAEEAGDDDKVKRYKALIDKIKSGKKFGESREEDSFWSSIDEELQILDEVESPKAPQKLMTFEEYRTRK